jgi:hypothetical protein
VDHGFGWGCLVGKKVMLMVIEIENASWLKRRESGIT